MKAFKYLFGAALLGMTFTACEDLDLESKGNIDETVLFKSDAGVQKYLARIYNDLPIEDFNYGVSGDQPGYCKHDGNQWQALKSYSGSCSGETAGRSGSYSGAEDYDYWPYDNIRLINNFMEALPRYEENFTAEAYENLLGEARCLRAFYYFGMVKRYGGVPIVTEVQDPFADKEELQLPRATEYETWKFIHDDLAYAMEHASTDRENTTRVNRYVAAALMSKAMLYAGSIAKYGGTVGTTGPAVEAGLQGMSESDAKEFFQYSYDAAKFLQESGRFALHTGSDKVQAYCEVFIGDNKSDEDIFVKKFGDIVDQVTLDHMGLLHCWDGMILPKGPGLSQNVGCAIQPVWETIGLFEHPALVDENGRPVRFNSLADFANSPELEPRAKADFFFPGMTEPVSGTVIDLQAGVYKSYPGTAEDGCPEANSSNYTETYRVQAGNQGSYQVIGGVNMKVSGDHGLGTSRGDEDYGYTGAFIRKYMDYTAPATVRVLFGSHSAFKAFRYGEILCNWAEAAYELGLIDENSALKREAIDHINELRDRAGAHPYTLKLVPEDVGTETIGYALDENLQFIRDERARELCFENQHFWDLRRWRSGDALFQQFWPHTLMGYYVADEGKYIFLNEFETHIGRRVTWQKSNYYRQIPAGEINKNPLLVRNDGF